MTTIPRPGDDAPDFALPDETGTIRRLADARGRWLVLYLYPRDDTPGCTTEACEFRDAHAAVEAAGAVVWGVSRDGAGSHARFRAKHDLPFTLLSDEAHETIERYGSWVEKVKYGKRSMGTARRTFLIDPDGRVEAVWEKVNPVGHAADVLVALDAARARRAGAEVGRA